ncbi:hypothetical protein Leryth_010562 [Lithospermum erythrorhizon]|nr:hypothetical protein Leryth_010562 [Lithospermum erythrorhizon]
MGRAPCCEKVGLNRGPWTNEEDQLLINYINENGHGNWRALPKKAGLLRCGKSCRLRWTNYLRPDIKRGNFTKEEEDAIIQLHQELGNKWSTIASRLAGRTDNEIKNVWHTHLKKRLDNQPEETKRQRTRKRSKKIDTSEQPVKNNSAIKDNNNDKNNDGDQEDIIMKETNSPSQSSETTSTLTSSSCTSSINDDTLEKFLDDDFWADVLSGNLSNMDANHLPQVNGIGIEEHKTYPLLPTSPVLLDLDGFEYFDPNKSQDDEMDFWCNYLARDGELQELLSNV